MVSRTQVRDITEGGEAGSQVATPSPTQPAGDEAAPVLRRQARPDAVLPVASEESEVVLHGDSFRLGLL